MKILTYKIITPERIVLEGEAVSLSAMTESGEITVLGDHAPLVSLLKAGEMRIKTLAGDELLLAASTGVLEVQTGGQIVILAHTAERSEELELEQIIAAKLLAEQNLAHVRAREDVSFADAAAHLERELARYHVALKTKKRRV